MAGNPWSKFFWQDWESDQALKLCSLAAQGLWMRMLCIAAAHDPIGYVAVAGKALDETDLARLTGASESEVSSLLGELAAKGVFSRDRHQRIYSRRMIRDARKVDTARKNGKLGGNPTLGKTSENSGSDNPPVKARVKGGDKPHKPEARSQISPSGDTRASARDCPDKVEDQVWRDFLAMRKAKRAPVTETALTKIANQAELAGWSLNDALAECVARGWQGFKAEWVERRSVAPNGAARAPSEPMDFLDYKIEQRRRREEWERRQQEAAAK